jgi:hypothetical protein
MYSGFPSLITLTTRRPTLRIHEIKLMVRGEAHQGPKEIIYYYGRGEGLEGRGGQTVGNLDEFILHPRPGHKKTSVYFCIRSVHCTTEKRCIGFGMNT